MNRYRTRLFEANSLESEDVGAFADSNGWKMDDWTTAYADAGYTLKSVQPVAYDGSLYVVVTMERAALGDSDNA